MALRIPIGRGKRFQIWPPIKSPGSKKRFKGVAKGWDIDRKVVVTNWYSGRWGFSGWYERRKK